MGNLPLLTKSYKSCGISTSNEKLKVRLVVGHLIFTYRKESITLRKYIYLIFYITTLIYLFLFLNLKSIKLKYYQ